MPLWKDRELLARDEVASNFGVADAERFARTLAMRLGVDPDYVTPAFEDPFYHLHQERQLPINVEPVKNQLADPLERERIRKVFERGLDTPVGVVLPLQRGVGKSGPEWQTGLWMLRGQHLYLLPGDSPVGCGCRCRVCRGWRRKMCLRCMSRIRSCCVRRCRFPRGESRSSAAGGRRGRPTERDRKPKVGESAPWIVRRALCVEPRDGRLHIFMPPVDGAEDYVELLAALEDTAAHLEMPVVIEGYTPPHDARIEHIKVTPDPGVIEVNVHPASNWRELVDNTTAVYEEAPGCGWAPRNSCSMDGTPAPAAATISCWAGRRRRIVRSCGVRICCAA